MAQSRILLGAAFLVLVFWLWPNLPYAPPLPLEGHAGDVIFMHYLLVHSGSANHASHIRVGLNTAVMPDPEQSYVRKNGPPQPDWTPLDYTLRTDI